jgi:hypothetical protein
MSLQAGYQIWKFPDLDITGNASTGIIAKTLFTAKAFHPVRANNLRDHETRSMAYPVGYAGKGGEGSVLRKQLI